MKRFALLSGAICSAFVSHAQNVGIGTTQPLEKLQVTGNLLVQQPYTFTNNAPIPVQTKTMLNATTINFSTGDSTGRIYDPGGPAGNYLANLSATAAIPHFGKGMEIMIEDIDLNTGDSLIFTDAHGRRVFEVGNGYSTTGRSVYNTGSLSILFKTNSDAQVGRGFSLVFRRLYVITNIPAFNGAFGNAIYFDAAKGIFRVGELSNLGPSGTATLNKGLHSTGIGTGITASGDYSTALGAYTEARGDNSIAIGTFSAASGDYSTAMGYGALASGNSATAIGNTTMARGDNSTAMGNFTDASGDNSTTLGNYVSTNNFLGALVIGDHSTTSTMNATADNTFRARFAGGYRFYTSSDLTSNALLGAGQNAWSTSSNVHLKENFQTLNGETFLQKIKAMNLVSWNYIGQDAKTFRHYGPMAQEFYAAFGKDEYGTIGNDTTINQADFDGVNLIAIQALEKRTNDLQKENEELKARLERLEKLIANKQ